MFYALVSCRVFILASRGLPDPDLCPKTSLGDFGPKTTCAHSTSKSCPSLRHSKRMWNVNRRQKSDLWLIVRSLWLYRLVRVGIEIKRMTDLELRRRVWVVEVHERLAAFEGRSWSSLLPSETSWWTCTMTHIYNSQHVTGMNSKR